MGAKLDKLKARLAGKPSDFTFDELRSLLEHLGFVYSNKGSTSGSRVRFYRERDGCIIQLHKPHPGSIVNKATLSDVIKKLKEGGDLDE